MSWTFMSRNSRPFSFYADWLDWFQVSPSRWGRVEGNLIATAPRCFVAPRASLDMLAPASGRKWPKRGGGVRNKSVRSVSGWSVVIIFSIGIGSGCSDDAGSSTGDSSTTIEVPSPTPTPSSMPAPGPEPIPAPPVADVDPKPVELSSEELIAGGRSVYNANCIACHSLDPTMDGALGPAVSGSSLALIEARILRSEYPEGYVPKRPTKVMIALPHLKPRLAELVAYLNSLE